MRVRVLLGLAVFILSGCAHTASNSSMRSEASLEVAYAHAVRDASLAVESKVADNLIAITSDNEALQWEEGKLLVVTWKSQGSYDQNIKPHAATSTNEAYVVWVTTAPQVQAFCSNYHRAQPNATDADVELRLKQYLGLHYDWSYDIFVELWVDPNDLFRPCVDPEIDDNTCSLSFDKDNPPTVEGIADYTAFYKNLFFDDFRYQPGVPWTGLGYTYDWGNPSTSEGASEFILRPGSPYTIAGTTPTAEYCRPE